MAKMTNSKGVDTYNTIMEFNYSASTRVNNILADRSTSRRKKSMYCDCDATLRKNAKQKELQQKLRDKRRKELEKLVAEHKRRQATT